MKRSVSTLTGDYCGKDAPVFNLDSVLFINMLKGLGERMVASGDPDPFFHKCAVSAFKSRESECMAQYKKHNAYIPMMASVYLFSPKSARATHQERVPGVYVSDKLYHKLFPNGRQTPVTA